MKTLIVDDEFVSRAKMQAIMETFGECVDADNGPDAIVLFNEALDSDHPFDLITLDIAMPEMDGIEVLFNLREIEKKRCTQDKNQVKILMVTAQSDKDYIVTCLQAGCNNYVVKPFDLDIVSQKLKQIELLPASAKKTNENKGPDAASPQALPGKIKTLIVDDEFVSRSKMQAIMESFGECVDVDNGTDAIALFDAALGSDQPFDLVTLDVAMPEMDGTEVLFNLREIEKKRDIQGGRQVKILMVTAQSDKDCIVTCLQAGCNSYVVKPFDLKIITQKLEEIQTKEQFQF